MEINTGYLIKKMLTAINLLAYAFMGLAVVFVVLTVAGVIFNAPNEFIKYTLRVVFSSGLAGFGIIALSVGATEAIGHK